MAEKYFYGYSNREWLRLVVCYVIFFLFGGIESSDGVYYGLMKTDLQIPYSVQGYLVSMNSWAFVLGSPLLGVLMTYVNVKPILVGGFVAYLVAYCVLFKVSLLWVVFIFLFIEGLGGVCLDVGMNTLSTVVFVTHRGVMMSYLHFFYGMGSTVGPIYSSKMLAVFNRGYRGIFIGLMIPAVVGIALTLCTHLSLKKEPLPDSDVSSREVKSEAKQSRLEDEQPETVPSTPPVSVDVNVAGESSPQNDLTVWQCFLSPMVWLLGINMGAVYAIESVTVNWAPLYLHDVYGMSIEEEGAKFVSLFYLFYTVARLVTGFLVDFLGDIVSMAVFSFVLIALYVVGFLMGKSGVMVLAASGLLISPLYPTAITVPMQVFGEKAKNTISVILCIACLVNLVIQVLIGYVNQCVGAAWGYRSMSIAMCILIILCMGITYLRLKHSSR